MTTDLMRNVKAVLEDKAVVGATAAGPSAGNYSAVQLWNPVASGVRLIVTRAWVGTDVSDAVDLREHNAALSGLTANKRLKHNLVAGGLGEVRAQNTASALGSFFGRVRTAANTTEVVDFSSFPLILNEGKGLLFESFGVNVQVFATVEWFEVSA